MRANLNGVDAFARDPNKFNDVRPRQIRLPSHNLEIIEKLRTFLPYSCCRVKSPIVITRLMTAYEALKTDRVIALCLVILASQFEKAAAE